MRAVQKTKRRARGPRPGKNGEVSLRGEGWRCNRANLLSRNAHRVRGSRHGEPLKALAVSGIVFALIFGGTLLGMLLRSRLPVHHLSTESKEVIRLATALVGTLAALVLGLLVASTRSSYEQTSGQISRMIVDAVVLDWLLAEYGPEATPLRQALRETIGSMADSIWRADTRPAGPFLADGAAETAYYK